MKKKETYQVNHPTIKDLSIGDILLLNDENTIVIVIGIQSTSLRFGYIVVKCYKGSMKVGTKIYTPLDDIYWNYDMDLRFSRLYYGKDKHLDVERKLPSLKEKLDLI